MNLSIRLTALDMAFRTSYYFLKAIAIAAQPLSPTKSSAILCKPFGKSELHTTISAFDKAFTGIQGARTGTQSETNPIKSCNLITAEYY